MLIKKLKNLLDEVSNNYEAEFNNILYEQFEDSLKYGIFCDKEKINKAYIKLKSTLPDNRNKILIDINELKKEFDDIKNCKRKVAIKEESTIMKYLNPNNEFYF